MWWEHYAAIAAYVDWKGGLPAQNDNTEARVLYRWLKNQRRIYDTGRLTQDKVAALGKLGSGWARGRATWRSCGRYASSRYDTSETRSAGSRSTTRNADPTRRSWPCGWAAKEPGAGKIASASNAGNDSTCVYRGGRRRNSALQCLDSGLSANHLVPLPGCTPAQQPPCGLFDVDRGDVDCVAPTGVYECCERIEEGSQDLAPCT